MTTITATSPSVTSSPSRRPKPRRQWGYTVLGVLFLAVMLFPIYWMVNVSLQRSGSGVSSSWFPTHLSFHGYSNAFRQQGGHLATSMIIGLGATAICLVVGAPAAYALAHFRLRGASLFLFALLISQMIPGIVIVNALYTLYNDLGLLNSLPGLILADASAGLPFAILILRAFMMNLPTPVMEAARVDGAGHIRTFVSIVLPMSTNALITAALFAFLGAWSDFLFALTLTTTGNVQPITLGLYQYVGAHNNDWSSVMATGVIASVPAIVLLVLAQRYIAAGATGGAVK